MRSPLAQPSLVQAPFAVAVDDGEEARIRKAFIYDQRAAMLINLLRVYIDSESKSCSDDLHWPCPRLHYHPPSQSVAAFAVVAASPAPR